MSKDTPKKASPIPKNKGESEILIDPPDNDPFARIPHRLLNDPSLSLKATGLLAYLLGKPQSWKVRVQDIQNRFTDGRDSIFTALNHLRAAGYASLEKVRNNAGRITGSRWRIAHSPRFKSPYPAFPDTVKPHLSKKDCSKNDPIPSKSRKPPSAKQRAAWNAWKRRQKSDNLAPTDRDPALINYARFGTEYWDGETIETAPLQFATDELP